MTCAEHLWWFDAPCPKCHHRLKPGEWEKIAAVEAVDVTAAVTVSPDAHEEPLRERTADDLDIPSFLRRDQFPRTPAAAGFSKTIAAPAVPVGPSNEPGMLELPTGSSLRSPDYTAWSAAMLSDAANSADLSLVARQPIYRELQRREELAKSRARIAKMKAARAAAVKPEKQDWET